MTRQDEIIEAIYGVEKGGGTLFTPAVNHAGMALRALYTSGRIEKNARCHDNRRRSGGL